MVPPWHMINVPRWHIEVKMAAIQSRKDENVVGSTIRLPRDLRDEMKIQAIRAGRSFNTHVVMLLRSALDPEAAQQK